jgi:hypothetical protein
MFSVSGVTSEEVRILSEKLFRFGELVKDSMTVSSLSVVFKGPELRRGVEGRGEEGLLDNVEKRGEDGVISGKGTSKVEVD